MKYDIRYSSAFKRDVKKIKKQNKDISLLTDVIKMLADGVILPKEYDDHALSGNWNGYRECHIQPDWLLIYKLTERELILTLVRTGSHSDLFRK